MLKRFFKKMRHSSELGQTSVEYIMMVGAVAVIVFSVAGNIRHWMIGDSGDCRQDPDAFVCRVAGANFFPERGYHNYRYFDFR